MVGRSSAPSLALLAPLLIPALVLGACGGPRSQGLEPTSPGVSRSGTPSWVEMPLTWDKLSSIESWLRTDGDRAEDYWRIEAWLQLAQGRLTLARRDLLAGGAARATLDQRLSGARTGFEQVLIDRSASSAQKSRARVGLDSAASLASGAVSASAPAARVLARSSWNARRANTRRMESSRGAWSRITVHHSAVENPPPISSIADAGAAVLDMQRVHMDINGWGDIGYHFLIDPTGHVFQGRELDWQGAHASGNNNIANLGVCLIGNFQRDRPTPAALAALEQLLAELRADYGIPASRVYSHKRFKNTQCPGRNLVAWVDRYRGRS